MKQSILLQSIELGAPSYDSTPVIIPDSDSESHSFLNAIGVFMNSEFGGILGGEIGVPRTITGSRA
jgi:hypothetical protein